MLPRSITLKAAIVNRDTGSHRDTVNRSSHNLDLLAQLGIRYISTTNLSIREAAKRYGPFDIMFEATGYSPVAFEAMESLGKNGVLILASVTGGDRQHPVPADKINLDFLLGNKLLVGTVNANREYFEAGVYHFALAELEFPGWLPKLLTHPVVGLDNYQDMMRLLTTERSAIKVYVNVAYDSTGAATAGVVLRSGILAMTS